MPTKIQWADETWNPIIGCSVVSPGCTNCYAMRDAWRLGHNPKTPQYKGLTDKVNGKPVWTGNTAVVWHKMQDPLKWKRPRRVFVNSEGDLFHDNITDSEIDMVFAMMARCPQHTFMILTKRPARMHVYVNNLVRGFMLSHTSNSRMIAAYRRLGCSLPLIASFPPRLWPLQNVWLGVSAEDQTRFDERVPFLTETWAYRRFISAEPLLGPIRMESWLRAGMIDWVIAGGESGPGWRDIPTLAFEQLLSQCAEFGVAFFMKQMPGGKKSPIPDWLNVQEFPAAA